MEGADDRVVLIGPDELAELVLAYPQGVLNLTPWFAFGEGATDVSPIRSLTSKL
jgi:hypothetical protein